MTESPETFDGVPPGLGLGRVFLRLDASGYVVAARTEDQREVAHEHWPALQTWVDASLAQH
jgi:hypothetical protein